MKAIDLNMTEAESGENEGKIAEEPPPFGERSEETMREIWNNLFDWRVMQSLRKERNDSLLKIAMLSKSLYWTYKVDLCQARHEMKNLTLQLEAEKNKKKHLKSRVKTWYSLHPEDFKEDELEVTGEETGVKPETLSDLELGIIRLPDKPETGVKRLSSEGPSEDEMWAKKIKIEQPTEDDKFDPLAFFKDDKPAECQDFFVPETVPNEDEPLFPENQAEPQIIPETLDESKDLFEETICVLRENSPKSNQVKIAPPTSPSTPTSPIVFRETPKSPIILTARSRRILFENRENCSPRSSSGANLSFTSSPAKKSVKSSPAKVEHSSTPKKHLTKPSCEPSPLKSEIVDVSPINSMKPSPLKLTVKPSVKPSPGKDSFIKPAVPVSPRLSPVKLVKGKENGLQLKFEPKQEVRRKEAKSKVTATYLGGRSKLEVTARDKSTRPVKLKQSKLSLSSFQGKRTLNTSAVTEEQLIQQAMEESLKFAEASARQSLDTDATFFETCPAEETFYQSNVEPATFFEEDTSLQTSKEQSSPVEAENLMTPSQRHASKFLDMTSWNEMPRCPTPKSVIQDEEGEEEISAERFFADSPEKVTAGKRLNTLEREFVQDYDRVPSKEAEGPGYVYKGEVVRKKQERQQLPGWECHECKGFNNEQCKGCDTQERREILNRCSRHRHKAPIIDNTPPGIWEIGLLKSQQGATQVGELEVHRSKPRGRKIDAAILVTQTSGDLL